jgi:hypothetical protein
MHVSNCPSTLPDADVNKNLHKCVSPPAGMTATNVAFPPTLGVYPSSEVANVSDGAKERLMVLNAASVAFPAQHEVQNIELAFI